MDDIEMYALEIVDDGDDHAEHEEHEEHEEDEENTERGSWIESNFYDTTYEWQYFKNRNTELSPYVLEDHKLIFCGIPKNAVSMWKMVLLRLLGKYSMKQTAFALKYYHYDYLLFNLSVPEWLCKLIPNELADKLAPNPDPNGLNAVALKRSRSTNLDKLRESVIAYADFVELYTAIIVLPQHLRPSCMPIIAECVEYGRCYPMFKVNATDHVQKLKQRLHSKTL